MTAVAPDPTGQAFAQLIDEAQHELYDIRRRYFVVAAFVKELNEVSRGKTFEIRHAVVWMMMIDLRDMLGINIGSWCKAAYGKGGLLGQIAAHHVSCLPCKKRKVTKARDAYLRRLDEEGHTQAVHRLFPDVVGPRPATADIQGLRDRFADVVRGAVDDRDNHRAHPWERGTTATTKMFDLPDWESTFAYVEQVLNDLRLVGTDSTWPAAELNIISGRAAAEDLVDQVLLGPLSQLDRARGGTTRMHFYEQLHARHDAGKATIFNGRELVI